MSPADSATAEDPVIDDDLVQALGFEPTSDSMLDEDFGSNKLYAEVLDVTGEDPVLTAAPESGADVSDAVDDQPVMAETDATGLIVLDAPPAAPTAPVQAPTGPPLLSPSFDQVAPAPLPRRLGPSEGDNHDYRVESVGRGRAKLRARKVRRVIRHIDPWSVLTFSVIFHLFIFGALLLASVLIFNAAEAAGTVENIESLIREIADLETFEINEGAVFKAAIVIAGMLTLAASVMIVLLTVVFNLISDLVGGIRVTVIEEERVRVVRRQQRAAAKPAKAEPPPPAAVETAPEKQ